MATVRAGKVAPGNPEGKRLAKKVEAERGALVARSGAPRISL